MSTQTTQRVKVSNDPNPDPITGAPGAHPVGTGLGAAGGAAAGAAIGSAAGPVGTAVGAVAGAVAGGLAGKGIAEAIDPTVEDAYWRDNYSSRPYAEKNVPYENYRPAIGQAMKGGRDTPARGSRRWNLTCRATSNAPGGIPRSPGRKRSRRRVTPGTGSSERCLAMQTATAVKRTARRSD